MKKLILASSSRYKRMLLESLSIEFSVFSPDVDESMLSGEAPLEYVKRLSESKARKVLETFPEAICIGADQCVALEGRILGKAPDFNSCHGQLMNMQGKTHELLTGVCVASRDFLKTDVEIHRMRMRKLSPEAIKRYIENEKPFDCAGSYKIEGLGISLFEEIEGNDPRAIIGLPLIKIVSILSEIGIDIP